MKTLRSLALLLCLAAPLARAAENQALTLAAARELALKTHPRITVAQLRSLVAREAATESRAGFFPFVALNATSVQSGEQVTRIASGSLSNSQIFDHTGIGATLSLLVTDFGRTANLADAAKQHARAVDADALATRAQLLLEVDAAYFGALKARAVKSVAAKTLASRQTLFERTRAFAQNQLKSDLDVKFAQVSFDEARLLSAEAEKNWQTELVKLTNLIGAKTAPDVAGLDNAPALSELPASDEPLQQLALRQRPELQRQRSEGDAARAMARAARDARLPTISIAAATGVVPNNDSHFQRDYAAGGINLNLPLFAGGLYRARQHEAELQANAAEAALVDQQNNAVRDVRLAWLEAGHAHERIALTASLLDNTNAALSLARARFDQGLSSIVELNQAELAQVSAEISHASAEYDYRMRREILDYETGSLH
jgi:outer membrane protein